MRQWRRRLLAGQTEDSLRVAFADESGTDGSSKCYAIGVLSFPRERLGHFTRAFSRLHAEHGVMGEVKWSKVGSSHGLINLAIAWLDRILRSRSASLDVIVVNTAQYRYWATRGANHEEAFYRTYTYLLRHVVRRARETTQVFIDDRSDAYPLHHEAVETIGNHMLAQLHTTGRLDGVTRMASSDSPGIQVADLLTGAFAAAHRRFLDPNANLNPGKRLAITRLAGLVGWDDLKYDTYPHPKLNVWHFPQEFRAMPETKTIAPASAPAYITAAELKSALRNSSQSPSG